MRIEHIHLKNYRCFDDLTVEFHKQLTVLVALNGGGKTSVLDAIKVALWPYVAGFDMGSTTNDVTGISIDDVRREQVRTHEMEPRLPAEIEADGEILDSKWLGVRCRNSIKKSTKTKDTMREQQPPSVVGLNDMAYTLQQSIFSGKQTEPVDLPMLGYYGTGRLWAQKKLTSIHDKSNSEVLSRTFAYRDCLDPVSSYKHFAQWYTRIFKSFRTAQIRNLVKGLPPDADMPSGLIAPVKAVQMTTDAILGHHTGWRELEYSEEHEELVLNHEQHGEIKVSQLSDGIRNMLALVGDIAYRCYKLNAHLGEDAPRKTHGIVMIDEVDMHLHPSWQQTVLTDLTGAFPNLQFIVTTHSPQVLSTVKSENIRMVFQDTLNQWVALPPPQEIKGVESATALNDIMGVNPIPPVDEAKWLADYTAKIESGTDQDSEGRALREKLLDLYGMQHPVMLDADRLIRFQAFKLRKKSTSQD